MRAWLGATLAATLAAAMPSGRPLVAQTVFQVEGGGNTVTGGYGSRVQLWSGAYEGWIGAGYSRGWRLGFFAKRPFGLDTLRVGFDAQPLAFATDLFTGGSYLLTQGAAWRRKRPTLDATLFAGATGTAAGAPFVNTARADKPLGFLALAYTPAPSLTLRSHTVIARQQTFLESVAWKSENAAHQLGATGGVGANKPYGALSWRAATERLELRAGYADFAHGFRRADAPLPNVAEPYRESVQLTLRAPRRAMLMLGHQNFRQDDSASLGAARATVDQAVANVSVLGFNVGAGVFQTAAPEGRSLSTFNSVNRTLPLRTTGTVMLFQTFRRGMAPLRTMQAELRERLTSRLAVSQVFSQSGKSVSAGVGGSFQHGFTTIAVDYQNYYVPLRQPDPFMRALNLTVRLQLGSSSVNIGSTLDPFGRMTYSASGSTYLYVGEAAGVQPIAVRFERWVIRGRVVDEAGKPIDGAAVDLGGELAMTNSRGEFFLRTKHREAVPVKLSFDDFLAVGHYELVSAPARVLPADEDDAEPVQIVVRTVGAAASPPDLHGLVQQGTVRGPPAPRGRGEPRDAPAAAPSRPLLALSTAAAIEQFANAYAMLAEIGRAAVDAARLDCCRAREGWRLFERPLPIRRF